MVTPENSSRPDHRYICIRGEAPSSGVDMLALLRAPEIAASWASARSTTTDSLVAASGLLLVGGVPQATITDLNIAIDGKGAAADGVVGSDIRPDVFVGKVSVSGSFTAYFDSATVPNMFVNETATSIVSALTAGTAANADFVTLTMSNVRINSSTPGDNETGLKRTYNFVAVLNAAGGSGTATEKTTLFVQDSAAA